MKIRKAVIPAAGFGTRFLPATKASPKEMLPIVDKPIVQYIVEELVEAGITEIIIVTGYHKRAIEDHFDEPNLDLIENIRRGGPQKSHLLDQLTEISKLANFSYVRQKGSYGNGTPLLNVKNLVGREPFIYTFSDDFIVAKPSRFKQMIKAYEQYQTPILASIQAEKDDDYDRYGFVGGRKLKSGILKVEVLMEKPGKSNAPSNMATVSSAILTPDIFDYLDRAYQNLAEGREFYWNDALKLMLGDKKKIIAMKIKNGRYYDTGNKLEYLKTLVDFALKRDDIGEEFRKYLEQKIKE